MEQVWRLAPTPALRVRATPGAAQWEPNDAARQWQRDWGLGDADLDTLAASLVIPGDADRLLGPDDRRVRCRVVALPDGRLIWLKPLGGDNPQWDDERALIERALSMSDVSVWWIDAQMRRMNFVRRRADSLGSSGDFDSVPIEDHRAQIHPDDRAAVSRAAQEALAGNRVTEALLRYALPAGGWRTLLTRRVAHRDAAGRLLGLLGISIDVSDLTAERQRSVALAERIRLAAETIGLGFWSRNIDTGVGEWDDQMYRLHDRRPQEGPPDFDEWIKRHVHPLDQDWMRERQRQVNATWPTSDDFEFRIPVPGSDEVRWIHARNRHLRQGGQRVALGVHIDVTERHLAEAKARETARAEQASRAKTEFLARMSHELRTPLNAVLGFGQLMLHDADEPPSARQRDRLMRIEMAARRLLSMIEEVLELTGDTGEGAPLVIEQVVLDDLAAECLLQAEAAAVAAGVTLRCAVRPLAGELGTDRARLSRVLAQLVANAIGATPPGGQVELRSWPLERGGVPGWMLAVRDTGRGMSGEQLQAAFEPFQRPGADGQAIDDAGIGLALVRRHVQRLHGVIEADSRPGQGSEFRVWLPQQGASRAGTGEAGADVAAQVAPAGLRLVCVEDNPVNLLLLREVFGMRPSLQVRLCEDGTSALAAAAEFAPDVVLLDLQLPDLPGVEVMRRMRADPRLAASRYIALSANAMPDDVQAARDAGFDDYWTKPIDVRRFLAAIDALVVQLGRA